MKARWIVGLVVGFFGVSVGVASELYAQSTAIYACVNSSSGEVKIVTAETQCVGNRTLVQWNVVGPQGPTGPQGPAGLKGDPGPQGPAGAGARTEPMTFNVDCNAGDKIGFPPIIGGMTIELIPGDTLLVSGTCNENVNIREEIERVTLDGQGSTTIHGPNTTRSTIGISGRDIRIKGFTIDGGQDGVNVVGGGTARISGNTVQNAGRFGIIVGQKSLARINNNTIQNSSSHGIQVSESSSARIGFVIGFMVRDDGNNIIQNNGGNGVLVTRSSFASIVTNTISNNARAGVVVTRTSQAEVGGNTINANAQDGIFVTENSGVEVGFVGFDEPNTTTVNNTGVGLRCRAGGVATGSIGTLTGASGQKSFGTTVALTENPAVTVNSEGCIDRMSP